MPLESVFLFSVCFCFVGSKNCIEWCLENPQPLCPLFCAIFHQLLFDKYYFVLLSGEFWVLVASGFMWICLVLGFFPYCCFSRCWCILSVWLLTFAPLLSGFTPVFTLCPLCIPLHIWFHHIQGCKMMSIILFPPVFTLSICFFSLSYLSVLTCLKFASLTSSSELQKRWLLHRRLFKH